jgi:flagellar hook-length control protein FliK
MAAVTATPSATPTAATPATTAAPTSPATSVATVAHGDTPGAGSYTSKDDSAGDRAAGGQAPPPGLPAAASTTAPVVQPAPVATAAPVAARTPSVAAVPTSYGVRLAEAAEKVSNTIAMGARDGVSVARIELAPESLGAIQIHLQHTSEGIVARVVTEHPEAAQTLSQGGDDLKRQLQQNGTTLLRLDIESSDRDRAGQQGETDGAAGSSSQASESGTATDTADDDGPAGAGAGTPLHTLSGSALVNVLA